MYIYIYMTAKPEAESGAFLDSGPRLQREGVLRSKLRKRSHLNAGPKNRGLGFRVLGLRFRV